MGKFNEYTQKATPADNDTLMIYDATSKANKLSPFSGIWNWIVEKLTNAVISNLQTSNQTVVGALNELSSRSSIPIKEVIRYKGDDSMMNVTNVPNNTVYFRILMMDKMHPVLLASGGILVGYLLQPDYCRQMFYSSQVIASRTCYGGKWSDWAPINSNALRQVDDNVEDWNNIASPGIYSGNGSTSKNAPIKAAMWINAFVVPSNGNVKYLTAHAITNEGVFFRNMNDGRWEAWIQIK